MHDPSGGAAVAFQRKEPLMAFLGNLEFVEGRPASKTAKLVLQLCLGCGTKDEGKAVGAFLKGIRIVPDAFFKDIEDDWNSKPFIGEHVFKVVQSAGYEGTEHDLWDSVTGNPAPYPVKISKADRLKKATAALVEAKAKKKTVRRKTTKVAMAS
jgi:hypothetical protein